VLATLTTYARSVADLRATIISALIYPTIVVVLAFCLFGMVSYFVIPQFVQLFQDLGLELPWLTSWVLKLGGHPGKIVAVPLAAVILEIILFRLFVRNTETGRVAWARFVYSIPVVGTLIRAERLAAFSELLAILVDHGLPLPEAFRLAGDASSDPVMERIA